MGPVSVGNKRDISREMKLQVSENFQIVFAMYDQELSRNEVSPSFQRLRTMVGQHIDQMIRTRNFEAPNGRIET